MNFESIITCAAIFVDCVLIFLHLRSEGRKVTEARRRSVPYQPTFRTIILTLTLVGGVLCLTIHALRPTVFPLLFDNWTIIWKGIGTTLEVSALSIVLGSILGVSAALILSVPKQNIWLSLIDSVLLALIYILLGIPALVLLFLAYYGLPFPVFWSSVLALSLNLSPFVAKIVTANIENISKDQVDSAISFGYNTWQVFWHFKFNFVLKNASQSLLVEYYTTIKLSSLAGVFTLREFYHATVDMTVHTYEPINSYLILAIGYVLIVSWMAVLADFLHKKWIPNAQ